jgi:hypothetical protein
MLIELQLNIFLVAYKVAAEILILAASLQLKEVIQTVKLL